VDSKFETLGRFCLKNASFKAKVLFGHVTSKWTSAIMAPSNSGPRPALTVVGENARHMMDSQMFVAMKSEIPLPRP